jgi:hypothetical protein
MIKTKACPKCGSTEDVVHKDHLMKEQNHAAVHHGGHMLHGAAHGHPAGLVVVAACWVASRLLHRVCKPWTCRFCGHDFA